MKKLLLLSVFLTASGSALCMAKNKASKINHGNAVNALYQKQTGEEAYNNAQQIWKHLPKEDQKNALRGVARIKDNLEEQLQPKSWAKYKHFLTHVVIPSASAIGLFYASYRLSKKSNILIPGSITLTFMKKTFQSSLLGATSFVSGIGALSYSIYGGLKNYHWQTNTMEALREAGSILEYHDYTGLMEEIEEENRQFQITLELEEARRQRGDDQEEKGN